MWDINNRNILLTGGTSGIGKITALELSKAGAKITLAYRNEAKAVNTKEYIESQSDSVVELIKCDLASFKSVKQCCEEYMVRNQNLHVLINNAGVWNTRFHKSEDGIEQTFQVNLLSPFYMTRLLLGRLTKDAPSRIITIGSGIHQGTLNFDDIELRDKFYGVHAYRQSKLGIILFTRLLAKKLNGSGVTANIAHPGLVSTQIGRKGSFLARLFFKLFGRSPKKGAETTIYLATSDEVSNVSGGFFKNKALSASSRESHDMLLAQRLWKVAEGYMPEPLPSVDEIIGNIYKEEPSGE